MGKQTIFLLQPKCETRGWRYWDGNV